MGIGKITCASDIAFGLCFISVRIHPGRGQFSGLVPATSCGDKSHRVNWPFLLQNLVAGTNFGPFD